MRRRALVLVAIIVAALAACAGVLGLRKSEPQPFPHRKHVLSGVPCTRCHAGVERRNDPALHLPDEASCLGCHQKPHNPNPCFACHSRPTAREELIEAREHLRFDHGEHMPHARGNCMRCHVGVSEGDDRLRPQMASCFKCHDDLQAKRQCDACHLDLEAGTDMPASHLAHDGDWIRDHGTRAASSADLCQTCHSERSCSACHGVTVGVLPKSRELGDPFSASIHRANFKARHSLEARADPGACQTCHSPDRCAECHVERGVAGAGRASPHPPGWVGVTDNQHGREARRDPASCAGCHGGAGEQLCVECHRVGGIGGSPHPAGWSSNQPLTALPCRLCHPLGGR
jgi:hypothetical protein